MSAALPAGLMSPDPCALRVPYVKLSFFFFPLGRLLHLLAETMEDVGFFRFSP